MELEKGSGCEPRTAGLKTKIAQTVPGMEDPQSLTGSCDGQMKKTWRLWHRKAEIHVKRVKAAAKEDNPEKQ